MSSDEEDDFEASSSGGDFSDDSADDWDPKNESEDDSELETQTGSSPSPEKRIRSKAPATKKKAASNIRPTTTGKKMSASILQLLDAAKAKKREKLNISSTSEAGPSKANDTPSPKQTITTHDSEDSSSSGDENLVNPSNLDLRSSFFQPLSAREKRTPTPNFDCNIGVGNLSESAEEDEEGEDEEDSPKPVDVMANLRNFNQNIHDAKENLKKYASKSGDPPKHTSTDVSQLLAMGETSATQDKSPAKKKTVAPKKRALKAEESAESDWEEVQDVKVERKPDNKPLEDVQVHLGVHPDRRREKIQNELEAALKRQLNKEKRDQQLLLHQGGFKDWLEQGNYINGILNDTALFGVALKLLPSAQSYPKDKADLAYFEQITKWYVGAIKVAPTTDMYPPLADDLDLKASLRRQIEAKAVKSKRDFVLIFIILLRAIGIQCRMLVNVVGPPIRPPQSELCRITMKPKEDEKSKKSDVGGTKRVKTEKAVKKEEEDDLDFDEIAERLSTSKKKSSSSGHSKSTSTKPANGTTKKKSDSKPSPSSTSTSKDKATTTTKAASTSSKAKRKKETIDIPPQPLSLRATRSRAPAAALIPQVDGLDDVVSSPIGKRTRSRSNTPVPPPPQLVKKVVMSKHSLDSPITKRKTTNNHTLKVPEPDALFAIDPQEKKSVTRARKSPSRTKASNVAVKRSTDTKSEAAANDSDAPPKKSHRLSEVKRIDRRVLSTDDDEGPANDKAKPNQSKTKVDFWAEAWSEQEDKWMCVDLFNTKVNSPESIVRGTTVPIAYVLAWNNNCSVKDVSLRYCPQWHSVNKKMRTDQSFIDATLKPFIGTTTDRDKKEDLEMKRLILDRPMPTSIADFKNHPLFALERHLLKFEAIYPPNAPIFGRFGARKEVIYARECVHTLHSRELWVKQARVVKPAETPYKIVTARPKWEKATSTVIKDLPLELFGLWQTSEYEPPVAQNGIVPKNPYGNVELFKACMLPINTVHLPYPGVNKVCKRLKVDYAPAVVGFDFHSGYSHPVYEGYVVCQEFAELVTDEWVKDTEEAAKRDAEKYQERVLGNWKRLIKGLLIRRRLQSKYNFGEKE